MHNDIKIMGQRQTKNTGSFGDTANDIPPEVSFDDFEVLRAIGRGAFGKVMIRHYHMASNFHGIFTKYHFKPLCHDKTEI